MNTQSCLPLALACLAPLAAPAQITSYDLFKINYFSQNAFETPMETFWRAVPRAFATAAGDFATGSVTRPAPLDPVSLTLNGTVWIYDESFISLADLDDAFPDGEHYAFDLSGGTEPGVSFMLPLPAGGFWPDTVPAFDTGSRDALLAGPDAALDLTLAFNSFTDETDATEDRSSSLFLRIFKVADNSEVYFNSGSPGTGSFIVPGGTLAGGVSYLAEVIFQNADGFAPMGGGGPTGFASYAYITQIEFTAVPEPGAAALAAGLALGGWAVWRRRRKPAA